MPALAMLAVLAACAAPGRLGMRDDRAFEVSAAWVGGRPAVAWYGGRLAHEAIFLQFADAGGTLAGAPLQLSDASRDAYEPSLQGLQGDALVAWYEQESASRGERRRRWAMLARFDSSGRRLWQQQLSAQDAGGRNPVVRVAGDVIHAAWLEQRGDAAPVVRVASLDAEGHWLHAPRDAAVAGLDTWNLNAAISADGGFHVLFDSGQGSGARELHWLRVKDGALGDSSVSRNDGSESLYPDIAFDESAYAVAWFDTRDGNEEVYLRCGRLDSSGGLPPGLLLDDPSARRVTRTPTHSIGAYLVWNEGHIELAWTEASEGRSALWRQTFDKGCRPLTTAYRVDAGNAMAGIPSLAPSTSGLVIAWNSQCIDSAATSRDRSHSPSSIVMLKVWPRGAISPSAAVR
jgi:hypothetical protein